MRPQPVHETQETDADDAESDLDEPSARGASLFRSRRFFVVDDRVEVGPAFRSGTPPPDPALSSVRSVTPPSSSKTIATPSSSSPLPSSVRSFGSPSSPNVIATPSSPPSLSLPPVRSPESPVSPDPLPLDAAAAPTVLDSLSTPAPPCTVGPSGPTAASADSDPEVSFAATLPTSGPDRSSGGGDGDALDVGTSSRSVPIPLWRSNVSRLSRSTRTISDRSAARSASSDAPPVVTRYGRPTWRSSRIAS